MRHSANKRFEFARTARSTLKRASWLAWCQVWHTQWLIPVSAIE
jgi:hypothetical protein